MKPNIKSIGLTVICAGLFLGMLIGGQLILKNFYVAGQFKEQLFQINGVTQVSVNNNEILLTLRKVDNLKTLYNSVEKSLGGKNYQISIVDNSSGQLKELADQSELALQEAMMQGNFTEMADYIKNIAHQKGARAKVYVDTKRIYMQIDLGNNSLYRVIERPDLSALSVQNT